MSREPAPAPRLAELRPACATVAARARSVRIEPARLDAYAVELGSAPAPAGDLESPPAGDPELIAAFWLTLDAVNFGSGWFPTLRKAGNTTGYRTVTAGIRRRFESAGAWPAAELAALTAAELAGWLGQDPEHPLMGWFATSLRDFGTRLTEGFAGSFLALARSTGGSAPALAEQLGAWPCFADSAHYDELRLPFLKRAQIAAADLHRAGVIRAVDLDGLTMFADNLVPHVLRLDGVLRFDPGLVARIECGALIEAGSREEVEIRACAVHAVELLRARLPARTAADLDAQLWQRGQAPPYKAVPRHRCRSTAY